MAGRFGHDNSVVQTGLGDPHTYAKTKIFEHIKLPKLLVITYLSLSGFAVVM